MHAPKNVDDYFQVIDGRMTYYNGKQVGNVYKEVDGYYVLSFDSAGGFWDGFSLQAMGRLLDKMNESWDAEVSEYFDE